MRFERWIRSNDSAMTTFTPSSDVPFAAQSREDPEPYSLPARMTRAARPPRSSGRVVDRRLVAGREVDREATLDARHQLVAQTDVRERPRIMISWLPRREP